ncbi:hypothetical protein BGX28_002611 [Mortierella sp. GBA30]|nr:hypothetical protein BGX28_002611 [Mortierella sp. GBA30]
MVQNVNYNWREIVSVSRSQLSKRVEGDDKHKGLAIETFGMSMSAQSYTIREGSLYRTALQRMGDAHQNIGTAQSELITRFGSSFLDSLEKSQAQMKEYQALQKKLQSRRQDYDAKLAKVQKAKKEKPEWEEEMQAAKAKYEETRENVLTLMTTINESQDDNVISLKSYYDAQLAYARRMVEILEAIPESTFATSPNGSRASVYSSNAGPRKLSRQNSHEPEDERSNYSDDQSSTHSIPNGRYPLDRAPSSADLRRHNTSQANPELSRSMSHLTPNAAQTRKNSGGGGSVRSSGFIAPPPVPPSRSRPQKQVRALYTFDATGEGELSIQKGDIIRIVEEIDEGWWEGELVDSNGIRHTGMFPSNYCEEVFSSDSGSTHRQGSINSNSSDPGRYLDEDEAAYYERETEPTVHYDEPEQEEVVHVPVARRAPPPPTRQASSYAPPASNSSANHANGASAVATPPTAAPRATPPQSRPVSAMSPVNRASTIGTRMPPPPPPTRRAAVESMRHSAVFSNASTPTTVSPPIMAAGAAGPSPPPTAVPSTPSMMGYIPKDYFSNQTPDPAEAAMGPCRECQCTDFSANVFKRGSCNNCFHIH